MYKGFWILSLLAISMIGLSCAGNVSGPGNVRPGGLINVTVTPGDLANIDQRYAAYPDSFQVIGGIEGTSSNVNIFVLFSFGNGGYITALENAKQSYGADGIINSSADIKSTGVLGIFSSSKTVVKGIGIKFK